jgi:hypothetical protein
MLLLVVGALIPLGIGGLLVLLTRIETVMAETRRERARAQAALLAESAVAALHAGVTPQGAQRLGDFGRWSLRRESAGDWVAEGRAATPQAEFVCAIRIERTGDGTLRPVWRRQFLEPAVGN